MPVSAEGRISITYAEKSKRRGPDHAVHSQILLLLLTVGYLVVEVEVKGGRVFQ